MRPIFDLFRISISSSTDLAKNSPCGNFTILKKFARVAGPRFCRHPTGFETSAWCYNHLHIVLGLFWDAFSNFRKIDIDIFSNSLFPTQSQLLLIFPFIFALYVVIDCTQTSRPGQNLSFRKWEPKTEDQIEVKDQNYAIIPFACQECESFRIN
jgi:hypothetical protein